MKFKLLIICILIIVILIAGLILKNNYIVKPREVKYYHGVVVDEKLKPINMVEISATHQGGHEFTNINGYFKIQTDAIIQSLIFGKIHYKTDTVDVVTTNVRDETRIYYRFVYKRLDTVVLMSKHMKNQEE